jgi:hypothetical protein
MPALHISTSSAGAAYEAANVATVDKSWGESTLVGATELLGIASFTLRSMMPKETSHALEEDAEAGLIAAMRIAIYYTNIT